MIENSYVAASAVFLIHTVFGLLILAAFMRLLLQWVRADFRNPLAQFLVKITNPVIVPLRRIIPSVAGLDIATLLPLLVLQVSETTLTQLVLGRGLFPAMIAVLSFAALLELVLTVYTVTVIAQALLSWAGPRGHHPATALLGQINAPVLGRAQRLIPTLSGIDLSPIVVLILIQLLKILLVAPLVDLAQGLR